MEYVKNVAFTKLIKVNGILREFNFRRKFVSGHPVYDIDANDDRGNRHYFSVRRDDKNWTIGDATVADWIRDASPGFYAAIVEQEAGD